MKTFCFSLLGAMFLLVPQLPAAVIAYWRFENNLLDSGSNGLNATTDGSGGFSYSTNLPGTEIDPGDLANTASYSRSGGTNATTAVIANATLTSTFEAASWTVEAFVRLNTGGQDGSLTLFSNRAAGEGVGFFLARDGGPGYTSLLAFTTGPGVSGTRNFPASGGGLAAEEWIHVAWTGKYTAGSGTALQFYVNGTGVGGTGFSGASGGVAMRMGTADWRIGGAGNNFNGMIDELRISNEALAPSQFLTAVPEPGTLVGLVLGCGLLLTRRTCRRNS